MKKIIVSGFFLVAVFCANSFAQKYVIQAKPLKGKFWGYINLEGEFIIEPQFERCGEFSYEGIAPVYDPGKDNFFLIDLNGDKLETEVPSFHLQNAFGHGVKGFTEGFAPVGYRGGWNYIDSKGRVLGDHLYDKAMPFDGGMAVAMDNDKYFLLDKNGQEKPIELPELRGVKRFSEGLAPYYTESKAFGFIDTDGNIAIDPRFLGVGYFSSGLAWAKDENGKLGFIDHTGTWIITPQFDVAKEFDPASGLARVRKDRQWCYVNKDGEILYVEDADGWGDFSEGLCKGRKKKKFGFYNAKGEWIIEPQFEGVRDFKNGYAAAQIDEKWGIIDKNGNWVIQPSFLSIKDVEVVRD